MSSAITIHFVLSEKLPFVLEAEKEIEATIFANLGGDFLGYLRLSESSMDVSQSNSLGRSETRLLLPSKRYLPDFNSNASKVKKQVVYCIAER